MIRSTLSWIEKVNKEYNIKPDRVLDVGSRDYKNITQQGGNPRYLFPDSEYIGIDIREGRNVDKVLSAYELSAHFGENHFDAVLCLCVFEHLANIWKVLGEIDSVLKRGGYFYVSMPSLGFPKHDYPKDYWRATEEAMREAIMEGYDILSFEYARTVSGKYQMMNCLGVKKA